MQISKHLFVMLYLFVTVKRESQIPSTILSDVLFEIDDDLTFQDLLQQADLEYKSSEIVKVEVRCVGNKQYNTVASGVKSSLALCRKDERNVSHIRFTISDGSIQSTRSTSSNDYLNAFNIMMEQSSIRSLPPPKSGNTKRDKLYNDMLFILREKNCGWLNGNETTVGKRFLESLNALLWELDEHHQKLQDRGCQIPEFVLSLHGYQNKQYYKKESHHKKGNLQRSKLDLLVKGIENCISQPWAASDLWSEFIREVFMLISCVQKYMEYLENVNRSVNTIRNAMQPARNPLDNSDIKILIECFRQDLKDCYKSLATKIRETNAYEVVLLDEYLPQNKYERYNFIQNLQLDSTIMLYRYYHGNYLGTLNFIWRIPLDPNERSDNLQAKIIIEIQEKLPHYFTRGMRKNIFERVFF